MNKQDTIHSLEANRDKWTKSEAESWTEKYPELGTGKIDLNKAVSPAFFELEREAIFRRNWIYMGRVEQVARPGEYFTREVEVCNTSIIVTRARDGEVRAFHNVCPHRGNKLVWEGHPAREVSGKAARFICKYHGFSFNHDGTLARAPDAENFFDNQIDTRCLIEVPLQTWNGFIFINLTPGGPAESLEEAMGPYYWTGFDGFPFAEFSERYVTEGSCKANWKTLMDAFAEGYHAPFLHHWTFPLFAADNIDVASARALHFSAHGKHRMSMFARLPEGLYSYPFEEQMQAHGSAPCIKTELSDIDLPPAANPIQSDNWSNSSHFFYPNFAIQFYYPMWWLTYEFIPVAHNEMRFRITHYLPPSKNFRELLSHHAFLAIYRDAALQDVNTLEATQRGIQTHAVDGFILQDEEFQIRHFYKQVFDAVDTYEREHKG